MKETYHCPANQDRVPIDKNYIAVMGKTFTVMEYLAQWSDTQEAVSFSRIAKDLPFSRTTVHRILHSLEKLGYVEKTKTPQYRLAARFFLLTSPAAQSRRLQSVSTSIMHSLQLRHAESVHLGRLDDGQIVYIDVRQGLSHLRSVAVPGYRTPAYCTALGKAILSRFPQPAIDEFLKHNALIRRTPTTITRQEQLIQSMALARNQKVAIDREENSVGVTCAAVPILDRTGWPIAALSISGPTLRITPKLERIQDDLRAAAVLVSRMLVAFPRLDGIG